MKVSKSELFLFELIIVILVFTISAAICISIFAKAYGFSTDSENLTVASIKTETIAEVFKSQSQNEGSEMPQSANADSDARAILDSIAGDGNTHDSKIRSQNEKYGEFTIDLYYDKDWNETDEKNKVYTITINAKEDEKSQNDELITAKIETKKNEISIFDVEVLKSL